MSLRIQVMITSIGLSAAALLLVSCGSGAPGPKEETADEVRQLRQRLETLTRQEKTISAEYSLARSQTPYLVVDLSARSIELKALARILRSFKITEIKRSAPPGKELDTWALVDKKPLRMNERPKITPGAGEQGAAAAEKALWGPHRMPPDYDLIFDGGRVMEVRGLPSEESGSRIVRALKAASRRMADWYRHWSESKDAMPRYTIQIWLAEGDSQALFWSLPKKADALVVDFGTGSK